MSEKKPYAELKAMLRGCPPAGSLYRHYKSGHFYVVVGSAVAEASQQPLVVYRLFGTVVDSDQDVQFARPLAEWTEVVEAEARRVARFEPCDAAEGPAR